MSTDVAEKPRTRLKPPQLYKVVLINDAYTPVEFVQQVLMLLFDKNQHEAQRVAAEIHRDGRGVGGIYTKEVADTKVNEVGQFAKSNKYPLKALAEPS
jgi:ATP-dependent Clp protease adaptor protein ClpS